MKRFFSALGVLAVAVAVSNTNTAATAPVEAATAPPTPPPPVRATPQIAPTTPGAGTLPDPKNGGAVTIPLTGAPTPAPSGSPGPERKTLDGVWEVVLQTTDGDPVYDHFSLKQKGSTLTGTFLDNQHNNKKYPCAGSIDGKAIHLVVTKDDGSTMVFDGTVEGYLDMIGLMKAGPQSIAFTAAYRPKEKFIDSISPVPGGFGGSASGGGYNPPR